MTSDFYLKVLSISSIVILHINRLANYGMTNKFSKHTVMKSSLLRACTLGPYIPLRTSFKRKRVANELCLLTHSHSILLCKMTSDFYLKVLSITLIVILHINRLANNGITNIIQEHTVMKSSVLRACTLGPYVPLRTSFKRKRVADELCLSSHIHDISLCKMTSDFKDFDT